MIYNYKYKTNCHSLPPKASLRDARTSLGGHNACSQLTHSSISKPICSSWI